MLAFFIELSKYFLIFDSSLGGSHTCDGYTVRTARYVVHTEFGTEFHRWRFTTMLTANTDFERRFGGTAFFHAHAYELPYTFLVENFERIGFEDTFFFVNL